MRIKRSALVLALTTSLRCQTVSAFSTSAAIARNHGVSSQLPEHSTVLRPRTATFGVLRLSSQTTTSSTVLSDDTTTETTNTLEASNNEKEEPQPSSTFDSEDSSLSTWVKHALLISSFGDGILSSPDAQAFLKYGLACSLLQERVRIAETAVRESVLASPCNGPDMDAFNSLETYDQQLQQYTTTSTSGESSNGDDNNNNPYNDVAANRLLRSLQNNNSNGGNEDETTTTTTTIRLLYIPTAMYALNPNSSNTPGKQRQRARADGKKRRNQVAQHVSDLLQPHLPNANVLAITLDLDDGSLKQPTGSNDDSDFPKDGVESLTTWAPHIVYVEGGNTFWLQYCLEKGNWQEPLQQACVGPDATALYVGKSAGAIIAGSTVETATWKGWDDPSVVPNFETYEKWQGYPGLAMVGPQRSFFPHMSQDWELLVEEKLTQMQDKQQSANVICLGELDAFCIDGNAQKVVMVSGQEG